MGVEDSENESEGENGEPSHASVQKNRAKSKSRNQPS